MKMMFNQVKTSETNSQLKDNFKSKQDWEQEYSSFKIKRETMR